MGQVFACHHPPATEACEAEQAETLCFPLLVDKNEDRLELWAHPGGERSLVWCRGARRRVLSRHLVTTMHYANESEMLIGFGDPQDYKVYSFRRISECSYLVHSRHAGKLWLMPTTRGQNPPGFVPADVALVLRIICTD